MKGRKLTKRVVDSIKPGETVRFVWDSEIPGFGLRCTPAGVRAYVVQYSRGARDTKRRVTIGRHGAPWTPESARQEAKRLLGLVAKGDDPAADREADKGAPTVATFAARYLAEHADLKKKVGSAAEDRRLLDRHIIPAVGPRLMRDVKRQDVTRLHSSLRDCPYLANRVLALASMMFNLAERWGVRPESTNPCRLVERFKEARRERFLSEKEFALLGTALDAAEKTGEPWQAIGALRLLVLTGRRHGEALGLRWQDVDLERGRLRLPDSKTGAKNFPLPAPAIKLLSDLPRIEGTDYVFPGRHGNGHFVGLTHVWYRVRKRAKLEDVRVHDLRHAFASVGVDGGASLPIIGALLGHTTAAMTQRYAHLSDDPVRAAGEKTARRIARALEGPTPGRTADVVSLRGR